MPSSSLTAASYQVLLALAAGRAHGYAMMAFVDEVSDGREQLPAGTLYRTLAKLVAEGLIGEAGDDRDPTASQDAQRRYYRLTPAGRKALAEEAARLERLVAAARDAGVLPRREVA